MSEEDKMTPELISREEDIPPKHEPPTKDPDSQYEQIHRAKQQEHEHIRDDRITKYGFFLVAGTLAGCCVLTFLYKDVALVDKFFTIASSTITLVLGYLFGRKEK